MIDTWYPAVTREARATLVGRIRCPAFALGSTAFNVQREGSTALVCEGAVNGLQSEVLSAFEDCTGQSGALLVVPEPSPHTMVDDLGSVLFDKYGLQTLHIYSQ
jgi:hypothetical protein